MITHTIDRFILNPKSILLTSSYRIPSQNKVKAEKLEKFAQKLKFYNFVINLTCNTPSNGSDYLWSSHATHLLMLVIICTKYGMNPSRTVDATERTWFSRSRPNDLENIGRGQRSLYATHPLILVIICAKYGKNPSRTVGQRSLHTTHPLMLMKICAKYGKNASRIVDFFFQGESRKK